MTISETRRIFILFLTAVCMVLIFSLVPSHAYIDRGDVEIGSPGTKSLSIGETTSVSITPYQEDHYPGCQMEECPRICGEKDCIVYVNGQMECTCKGTDMVTYYAEVETSSSDSSVATASYDNNGSVIVTAIGEGKATISVSAAFREYQPASKNFTVTVKSASVPDNTTEVTPADNGNDDSGTNDNNGSNSNPSDNSENNSPEGADNNGTDNNPETTGNDSTAVPDSSSNNDSTAVPGTSSNNDTAQKYKVNVASEEECHAVLKPDKAEAAEGTAVMITASASEGYKLKGIIVTDSQGNTISTKGVGGIFELIMPASDVKVTSDVSEIVPVTQKDFPFTDVAADRWSRSAIEFVFNRDLFNGTSESLFSPEITMTRGMLVTVLYRLDGSPEVLGDSSFTDVDSGEYYAKPVKWASDHEIVLGMEEGIFAPNQDITREQLVTIMHRYAKYKGYNAYFSGILQDFTDSRTISSYAQTPFKWAYSKGIITGVTSNTLEPQGNATREQVATIIMRFVQKFVE